MSNSSQNSSPGDEQEAALSIGDLADATGVSAATLRVWETRYGFPEPERRSSGHRRYEASDVDAVREVMRKRDEGARLDAAIKQVVADGVTPPQPRSTEPPSIFAHLRRTHPELAPQRLHKSTLLGVSWAVEDEFGARSASGHLFGAFQRERNYRAAEGRWKDLAAQADSTFVFAAPDSDRGPTRDQAAGTGPQWVSLPPGHAMLREWAVVCDGPELCVAVTAWELPGQDGVRDRDRLFEALWTLDPVAVREASRTAARVAVELGCRDAEPVVAELAADVDTDRNVDLGPTVALFNRVVSYMDSSPQQKKGYGKLSSVQDTGSGSGSDVG